jgi:hypothetical protein
MILQKIVLSLLVPLSVATTTLITPQDRGFSVGVGEQQIPNYLVATYVPMEDLTPSQSLYNAFIEVFGKDADIMWEVSRCESNRSQFNSDGSVKIGITGDIGIMQIAPQYHLEESIKLNYDIRTLMGNLLMAKHILSEQGLDAWRASKICWSSL